MFDRLRISVRGHQIRAPRIYTLWNLELFILKVTEYTVTHFMPLALSTPPENLWFSDVLRGGMKETSGMKWVNNLIKSLLSKMRFVETSGYFKFVNVSLDIQPSCVSLINQV